MEGRYIRLERGRHRWDVTINNPPVNILTAAVMGELSGVLAAAAEERDLRVLVLWGEGKAWSAGADVEEHLPGRFEAMLEAFGRLCEAVRRFPAPTIAAVDGMCLGGGCEVACLCDFVVATPRAKFGQPEVKVGVFPPAACAHYARRIGWAKAMEVILTGEVFGAEEALRLGLVNRLAPEGGLKAAVDELAAKFETLSAPVLRAAKRAALKGLAARPKEALREVNEVYRDQLMTLRDAEEGLRAFLDKRPPEWRDR